MKDEIKEIEILKKEIERLNNIINPKEVNYNYIKLLFKKNKKEEIIKAYVYKCEQLEKLYKSYEEKEIEVMKKDNIINELEKHLLDYLDEWQDSEDNFVKGRCLMARDVIHDIYELKEGK